MPHFAVLIYAPDSTHAPSATPRDLTDADQHVSELVDSGTLRVAYALTPRDAAVSVKVDGTRPEPFHGDLPIVAGFYVIEVDSLDEAVRIASRNPVVRDGGGVEVRPVHSGGYFTRA